MAFQDQIRVTLVKSLIGRKQSHRHCVRGLGLKRVNQSKIVANTPETRGMINKVGYLLKVEE
jgi:large subunit ribosomal protein L30